MNTTAARKPRILAVAPYEGLGTLFENAEKIRGNVQITVVVGNLYNGLQQARKAMSETDYDILISRGGTAELLRAQINKPILEIAITANDILHAVKLAEEYDGKSAFVGFEAVTRTASLLCQLLNFDMPVYTVHDSSQVDGILENLAQEGYNLVLCDVLASSKAVRLGLTPVLIASTQESVNNIIHEAVSIAQPILETKSQRYLYRELLETAPYAALVVDPQGEVLFSSMPKEKLAALQLSVPHLWDSLQPDHSISVRIGNAVHHLQCSSCALDPDWRLIYLRKTGIPIETDESFIETFPNKARLMDHLHRQPFYTAFCNYPALESIINSVSGLKPVLLTGTDSELLDFFAAQLFSQFQRDGDIFTVIDLSALNSYRFSWLFDSEESPLIGSGTTIHMKNCDALTQSQINRIAGFLKKSSFLSGNWILFSALRDKTSSPGAAIANSISLEVVDIPGLSTYPQQLRNMALICINHFNMLYSKQIIGLTPDAQERVRNYPWPGDFSQFKRVFQTLVIQAQESFIQEEDVARVLAQEDSLYPGTVPKPTEDSINLNQSLEAITHAVVKKVVENQGGNQKKAADILQISRTTIWRILKQGGKTP